MEYSWPLSIPQFNWIDKLKFASFILTNDRWTQGEEVARFEKEMADYVNVKYAVFTSSGSTANTLLAMYLRDHNEPDRNTVVFPSTTWITSVSPFLREGFDAEFIDIDLYDFSMDLDKLESYLKEHAATVSCVFVTSLIGFVPNIYKLTALGTKYGVRIMMDNCENTLGRYDGCNVSSFVTSTTSTYFGHQIQSVEGGFVFTNDDKEYEYFLMARNHGMVRQLPEDKLWIYRNLQVDEKFDFYMLGNNFRNSNLHAFVGLRDLKRADKYLKRRRALYRLFQYELGHFLILPEDKIGRVIEDAPFCLPFVLKRKYQNKFLALKSLCQNLGIETRPIISGNLLRQTCLRQSDFQRFTQSEYLQQFGFYIGLHGGTKKSDVEKLCYKVKTILGDESFMNKFS